MNALKELDTMARAIVHQHTRLALQAEALERLPIYLAALPTDIAGPIPQAVYAACRALDFIDADAQCVASAWQRQSERSGRFDASAWPTEPQDFGLRVLPVIASQHYPTRYRTRTLNKDIVTASEARQSMNSGAMDCHGADAPRNDVDLDRHCESGEGDLVRHCERSAAIQGPEFMDCHGADAPRNDESSGACFDAFAPCPYHLGLYAVLPDAAWVGRMARAGVPTVQLRFKSDDAAAIRREVQAAVQAVQGTSALLFINDHWQAAIKAGAYGVHLGQEDLEELGGADLNAIRAAGLRLGLSSHGYAEMLRAAAVKPSYIAMGAVYATTLKRMATPPQGLARLRMYAALLRDTATVAIGGIGAAQLPEVLACGVGSVAVVRALVAADQPEAQAAALQEVVKPFFS